ncbi:YnbE family lipoprotein [Photobacterium gaetbulicola]|uniref:YnbE family lipoprotein n=1 Tax=Photobacterium gaetbulicola TaxID=1295392 RepID=UPI000691BBA3|nr:YnbE family lipoprotein [Photobacterium gaetbulicola]
MDIHLKLFYIPFFIALISIMSMLAISGCTPTVQVTASDKPIEVNLNVKIEHEIRIKVDKEIDELFNDDDVF